MKVCSYLGAGVGGEKEICGKCVKQSLCGLLMAAVTLCFMLLSQQTPGRDEVADCGSGNYSTDQKSVKALTLHHVELLLHRPS